MSIDYFQIRKTSFLADWTKIESRCELNPACCGPGEFEQEYTDLSCPAVLGQLELQVPKFFFVTFAGFTCALDAPCNTLQSYLNQKGFSNGQNYVLRRKPNQAPFTGCNFITAPNPQQCCTLAQYEMIPGNQFVNCANGGFPCNFAAHNMQNTGTSTCVFLNPQTNCTERIIREWALSLSAELCACWSDDPLEWDSLTLTINGFEAVRVKSHTQAGANCPPLPPVNPAWNCDVLFHQNLIPSTCENGIAQIFFAQFAPPYLGSTNGPPPVFPLPQQTYAAFGCGGGTVNISD